MTPDIKSQLTMEVDTPRNSNVLQILDRYILDTDIQFRKNEIPYRFVFFLDWNLLNFIIFTTFANVVLKQYFL